MPRLVAIGTLLVLAAGCAANPAPAPPPAAILPVAPPPRPAARSSSDAASSFASLRDRVLSELLADDPATARDLGLHEYDGKVAPLSREAIAARVARLRRAEEELGAVPAAALTDDQALDLTELRHWVASRLFWLVDVDAPGTLPQAYGDLFELSTYLDRDYAPLSERAKGVLAQEEAAAAEVPHARENLVLPLSKPVAEVAARNFAGFASYLRGDVAKVMGSAGDASFRERFARVNEALAAQAEGLAKWLAVEAPRGNQRHVLGRARFAKLLEVQEGITTPLAEFERFNEDDLATNKSAYEALAKTVRPSPVVEAELFATARRYVEEARRFVVDRALVTLPADDGVTVRETPAYERWNAASIDMSGPFEKARSAYYQLTIPDRTWPAAKRAEYLGSLGDLLGTTVHEVYPGHFVQGRWAEKAPTAVQKAFQDYAFVEGWAHYGEQMMIDEGLGQGDPANRLAMLHGALLRNCRFSAAIAIHVKGATLDDVERRFVDDCHQDRPTAHEQAVRGTFDPGYFAYTLGKLQILKLREKAKAALGARFSLNRFHDALLSHGAPPLALIHDRVLKDLGAP
jgi:hypothetical protein